MSSDGSVTRWIRKTKAGDADAVQRLWERYFPQLVALCQKRLRGHLRRVADEEDVALSVFDSFCQRAAQGRFPQLQDRDDLWRLLVVIAARKAINLVHHDHRQRRGGQRVAREDDGDGPELEQLIGREPTPEFAARVAEEYERLLDRLQGPGLREIAQRKLDGYTNEEIAQELGCSLRTVERKLWVFRKRWSALDSNEKSDMEDSPWHRAMAMVRSQFTDRTWQAFWLAGVEKQAPADVAHHLEMTIDGVYQAKSRILRRLREEFHGLEPP